ncbi:META domain-containing protein [Algoriphagus sp.]|uniref:META domain-containing protein n=1 Tax=Algoriphagus sp. TaxID=1872435 RepID=UPI0025DE876C|nr:META domain-containing protein [Algoriphagus sp.]
MKVFKSISIILLAFLLVECKPVQKTAMGLLENKTWELNSMNDISSLQESFPSGVPTLEFSEAGKLTGFSGCNDFSGIYSLEGKKLKLDPGAMTRKACPGNGESSFITALGKVVKFKSSDTEIKLLGESGELMSFTPKN